MRAVLIIAIMFFAGSALADKNRHEYASVVSVDPIYRTISRTEPRQICEPVTIEIHRERPNRGGKLVGALIGGAIGHAVGHRHHHTGLGTVVGAVTGAHIGGASGRPRTEVEYRTEDRCRTEYTSFQESIIDGYDVGYRYQGKLYHTTTDRHPGKRIRVSVRVVPEWD